MTSLIVPQKDKSRRNRCHLVPFMMNIDGAKFEEHRFNTPRDMLDSVIYPFLERLMTSSLSSFAYHKENAIHLYFEKP